MQETMELYLILDNFKKRERQRKQGDLYFLYLPCFSMRAELSHLSNSYSHTMWCFLAGSEKLGLLMSWAFLSIWVHTQGWKRMSHQLNLASNINLKNRPLQCVCYDYAKYLDSPSTQHLELLSKLHYYAYCDQCWYRIIKTKILGI